MNGKKSGKKVICVETGEIFESIAVAAQKHNLHRANVSACVRGIVPRAGKLQWRYV